MYKKQKTTKKNKKNTTTKVQLLLAEFKLLGANAPKSAQEYLTEGCRLSAYVYDKAAELNQVPYYSRTCVNDRSMLLLR